MNALQCRRAARAQTSSGRYRMAAFAGLAAAAIVCGPAAGQNQDTFGEWKDPPETGHNWELGLDVFVEHAVHLPTGSILLWDFPDDESFLWDPVLDSHTEIDIPVAFNIHCSGHVGLPDGAILLAGGTNSNVETKIYSLDGCPPVLGYRQTTTWPTVVFTRPARHCPTAVCLRPPVV